MDNDHFISSSFSSTPSWLWDKEKREFKRKVDHPRYHAMLGKRKKDLIYSKRVSSMSRSNKSADHMIAISNSSISKWNNVDSRSSFTDQGAGCADYNRGNNKDIKAYYMHCFYLPLKMLQSVVKFANNGNDWASKDGKKIKGQVLSSKRKRRCSGSEIVLVHIWPFSCSLRKRNDDEDVDRKKYYIGFG